MDCAIPFGKLQRIWAVMMVCEVSLANVDTAISIYVVGSKPQAYNTRPKGNMGS